jgi:hypothetical protein
VAYRRSNDGLYRRLLLGVRSGPLESVRSLFVNEGHLLGGTRESAVIKITVHGEELRPVLYSVSWFTFTHPGQHYEQAELRLRNKRQRDALGRQQGQHHAEVGERLHNSRSLVSLLICPIKSARIQQRLRVQAYNRRSLKTGEKQRAIGKPVRTASIMGRNRASTVCCTPNLRQ